MPEYLAPGVYVEEVSFRSRSIEGVATSTTGYAGMTAFGPVQYGGGPSTTEPRLITSFTEFERVYGGLGKLLADVGGSVEERESYLAHAARAFFLNGGKRLYVSRVFMGAGGDGIARLDLTFAGAEGISGDEIPLGVLDRSGSITSFVDMWTARRELVEPTPGRYWQWRMAMRPLDVFWAQVLQFQCQLIADPVPGGPDGDDPCADERRALATVDEVLTTLRRAAPGTTEGDVPTVREVATARSLADGAAVAAVAGELPPAIAARLEELRGLVTGTLARPGGSSSGGSLLIDQGIVETPPAGYLPVDPDADVRRQVRAWMGPGVDLRLCAVRPDFVPEAQQEAQHMERISLTRGIDDPGSLEEVDVLVPGGEVGRETPATGVFEGEIRIVPGRRVTENGEVVEGSAVLLAAVAREQTGAGWSVSLAARGEAPHQLSVEALATALLGAAGGSGGSGEAAEVHLDEEADHAAALADAGFRLRSAREASRARVRRARIAHAAATGDAVEVADAAVAPTERRPISGWLDAEAADSIAGMQPGERTSLRLRGTVYSRASTNPVFHDLRVVGTATVLERRALPTGTGGGQTTVVTTRVSGTVDQLSVSGGPVDDALPTSIDVELRWRFDTSSTGSRLLSVEGGDPGERAGLELAERPTPRRVLGSFGVEERNPDGFRTGPWTGTTHALTGADVRQVGTGVLHERPGALDVGEPGRDLAASVIDVLSAALAEATREEGFAVFARSRMFDGLRAGGAATIRATEDWVMFHRRRTKRCATDEPERPVALRRFRWFHAVRGATEGPVDLGAADLAGWSEVGSGADRVATRVWARLDRLGYEPVAPVEFDEGSTQPRSPVAALRAAWSSADRGDRLAGALVATQGGGEGAGIERGRLATLAGAIADLVDVGPARIEVLDEVPPEFRAEGLHGVFLTVGTGPVVTPTACAHVFRLGKTAFARVMAELPQLSSVEEVRRMAVELDDTQPVVARFEGARLANKDEVVEWWPGTEAVGAALVLRGDLPADAEQAWLADRSDVLAELLGFRERSTTDGVALDTGECEAVYLVQESRR